MGVCMLEKVIEYFTNISLQKILVLLITLVFLILLFPIIDSNYLYYLRMEKRIDILDKISSIEVESIRHNKVLIEEYVKLLEEIEDFDEDKLISQKTIFYERTSMKQKQLKIGSGIILFFILFIYNLLEEYKWLNKLKIGVVIVILGLFFGWLSFILPTFRIPLINYIGMPVIEILLISVVYKIYKKSKEKVLDNKAS
jgi:hypothetical protein